MTKILYCEDEPDMRDLVAFSLRFAGYEVATGSNGEEAVQLAKKETPDLILLDVIMAAKEGPDVAIEIKRDPRLKETPIVFLTAKSREEDQARGLEAGANLFLSKPISPDRLLKIVADTLG